MNCIVLFKELLSEAEEGGFGDYLHGTQLQNLRVIIVHVAS